ncbi:MAG: ATP-binding protein [Candidatus Omnitrophota bacterium]
MKILLIEDNPDYVEITKRVLKKENTDYQVDSTEHPEEGMNKLLKGSYDAIVCDYRLPGWTAFDILRQMRENGNDMPLVVITALGSEKAAVGLMKEGASDYVVKDESYEYTLDMAIKRSVAYHREKKEKESLEEAIRKAYIELQETQNQLIQAEKLNAIGQLASGVAHEVRNPLGIILQGVDYLEAKLASKDKDIVETLAILKDGVKRADNIIDNLLNFSRAAALDLQLEDANSILENSLQLVKNRCKFENIEIVKELMTDGAKILVDKNKIEQVCVNILLNAIQAMPEGGRLIIRSYSRRLERARNGVGRRQGDYLKIGEKAVTFEFEDTGVGVSDDNINKIFDPFFTTKGPDGGTGLGLSVSRNIIHMHKGLIYAESRLGKGTKITVILKMAAR